MSGINPLGGAYLDYLLTGEYFDGKSVWISDCDITRLAYQQLLEAHPHLVTESPYSPYFRRDGIRVRGENVIQLSSIRASSAQERACLEAHQSGVRAGLTRPIAVFAGGPASKIAALLCACQGRGAPSSLFFIDGAEQSNESGSASYEHINHANALSAEFDNSGLAIFLTALRRALMGESNPETALKPEYRRVDLWPKGVTFRDILIYIQYEIQGLIQRTMRNFGWLNQNDKRRYASKMSSRVLTFLEDRAGVRLRMEVSTPRTFFLYMNQSQWRLAQHENRHLQKTLGLDIQGLSRNALVTSYGEAVLESICGGDVFPENGCIRHGFDRLVADALDRLGGSYRTRKRIREIYFAEQDASGGRGPNAVAVMVENISTGGMSFQPIDHLGLSLGPSATYHYHPDLCGGPTSSWFSDHLKLGWPVPYQTIATGVTMQVLFRITDKDRYHKLPFTGLKQTHFVEIGSDANHVLVKLTSGGNIGLPVYSRSYAISALASLLRIVTPNSGLSFIDVVCAWPCARGVNGPNNGQIVRLANNCAIRFGEGGTGMSKMGSNAQSLLDLVGVPHGLPSEATLDYCDYRHTVLDRRARVLKRLLRKHS
ncbi:MAG: hypothetical protein ACSLEZ_07085 [Thiobacillus sp.]